MDNFQAIGQLVIKAQDLLDSIKGGAIRVMQEQFDALKVQFSDKLSAVNTELAAFTVQQKAQVNTVFSDPDSRYQKITPIDFKIEGDTDKFYPVVFGCTDVNRLVDIHIGRFIHSDNANTGAMYAKFVASSYSWGARSSTMILDVLKTLISDSQIAYGDGFIADYRGSKQHPDGVIVWLRGGYSYQFWSEGSVLNGVSATTSKTELVSNGEAKVYLNGYENTIAGSPSLISVLTARNMTTVPEFTDYERA